VAHLAGEILISKTAANWLRVFLSSSAGAAAVAGADTVAGAAAVAGADTVAGAAAAAAGVSAVFLFAVRVVIIRKYIVIVSISLKESITFGVIITYKAKNNKLFLHKE
jgi:hypothetical protein